MISAENFITEIVIKKLNPTHIIVGKNFRLEKRTGKLLSLQESFAKNT